MAFIRTVWYFTKAPGLTANAEKGLCNPNVIASLINVDVLTKAGAGGLAIGALKGDYDKYMLNRGWEARRQAEEQLAEARKQVEEQRVESRKQVDEARKHRDDAVKEAGQQADAARQRAEEEQRRRADAVLDMVVELAGEMREERRQNAATQQAMLETLIQLAQRPGNGSRPAADDVKVSGQD